MPEAAHGVRWENPDLVRGRSVLIGEGVRKDPRCEGKILDAVFEAGGCRVLERAPGPHGPDFIPLMRYDDLFELLAPWVSSAVAFAQPQPAEPVEQPKLAPAVRTGRRQRAEPQAE